MAPPADTPALLTVGHSTLDADAFRALLQAHGVRHLADVRRFPASRRYPHFNRDALAASLAAAGIAYSHHEALGGRRRAAPDSPNDAWRNDSFRGYADYMLTDAFQRALQKLIDLAATTRVAILCAEAVPWRCHRSLIADALVARGLRVEHIMTEAKRDPHKLRDFARPQPDGTVLYPAATLFTSSGGSD